MPFDASKYADDPAFVSFIESKTKEAATAAADAAVTELKTKNAEILDEKKKLQGLMAKFDGLDVDKAKKAMDFIEKNETARLIAEGKSDEVIEQLTEKLRLKHQEQLDELTKKLSDSESTATTFRSRYEQKMVDDAIRAAASKAGILPEAVEDVLLRARSTFSFGEDGAIEARDAKGNLVKHEEKLLTPELWVTNLPRHYWPASAGSGFEGKDVSKIDAQLDSAAKSGDMKKYRALRKRQKSGSDS
jgi:hypothetical protein